MTKVFGALALACILESKRDLDRSQTMPRTRPIGNAGAPKARHGACTFSMPGFRRNQPHIHVRKEARWQVGGLILAYLQPVPRSVDGSFLSRRRGPVVRPVIHVPHITAAETRHAR